MMQVDENRKTGGVGFCGLLAIAFIVLKLLGVISWSWIWVLAPIWIPVVIIGLILVFIILWEKR